MNATNTPAATRAAPRVQQAAATTQQADKPTTGKPKLKLSLQKKAGEQSRVRATAQQQQAAPSYANAAAAADGTTEYTLVTGKARGNKALASKTLKPLYDPND